MHLRDSGLSSSVEPENFCLDLCGPGLVLSVSVRPPGLVWAEMFWKNSAWFWDDIAGSDDDSGFLLAAELRRTPDPASDTDKNRITFTSSSQSTGPGSSTGALNLATTNTDFTRSRSTTNQTQEIRDDRYTQQQAVSTRNRTKPQPLKPWILLEGFSLVLGFREWFQVLVCDVVLGFRM